MRSHTLHQSLKASSDYYARIFAPPPPGYAQKCILADLYAQTAGLELRLRALESEFGHIHRKYTFAHASKEDDNGDTGEDDGEPQGDNGGGNGNDSGGHYDSDEPRVPAGNPDGGEWTGGCVSVLPGSGLVMDDAGNIYQTPNYTDATAPDTWANPDLGKFEDHYEAHRADFGSTSPEEYAARANGFYNMGQDEKLPALETNHGYIKMYDPETNTFGAYNSEGQTNTFFKPTSSTYFERQTTKEIASGGRVIEPLPLEDPIVPEIFIP
jgi:hypothetical protein